MSEQVTLLVDCPACSGTGIYVSFTFQIPEGVICRKCQGIGAVKITIRPFTERSKVRDHLPVFLDKDSLIGVYVQTTQKDSRYRNISVDERELQQWNTSGVIYEMRETHVVTGDSKFSASHFETHYLIKHHIEDTFAWYAKDEFKLK